MGDVPNVVASSDGDCMAVTIAISTADQSAASLIVEVCRQVADQRVAIAPVVPARGLSSCPLRVHGGVLR